MTTPGRLRLYRLRDHTEAVEETMDDERARFSALASKAPARVISAFNLFQTPPDIAARMANIIGHVNGVRILEPSAGLGRLYHAMHRQATGCTFTLVEVAPQCAAELYRMTADDPQTTLIQDDFLQCDAARLGGRFDVIVMNPPFKQGRDRKHIAHALTLLAPGGRIVSLCYAGPRQREEFENRNGWTWETLPPGSFRSEGTSADVAMIWRDCP